MLIRGGGVTIASKNEVISKGNFGTENESVPKVGHFEMDHFESRPKVDFDSYKLYSLLDESYSKGPIFEVGYFGK